MENSYTFRVEPQFFFMRETRPIVLNDLLSVKDERLGIRRGQRLYRRPFQLSFSTIFSMGFANMELSLPNRKFQMMSDSQATKLVYFSQ